jgi:hypothetical protein
MPARLSQQEDEKGIMEVACPQAVSASLANTDGVRASRLPSPFIKGDFQRSNNAGRIGPGRGSPG